MRRLRQVKGVKINVHENLYNKMEEIRKFYMQGGIRLSQMQVTNIISQRIKPINKINILGVKNAKKKR